MRSMWSGSISFGLINIPVQLFSGTQDHGVDLDMLHKRDLSPIRYARICKEEEVEVPWKDIVKGYEFEKGRYVVLTDEDFERASAKKSKSIDLLFFTYESEIDSVYYDRVYFLQPDKGAAKPYRLLLQALKEAEKVGVAEFVMRGHRHIAVIKPYEDVIILNQLRFHSEIRDHSELNLPSEKVNQQELNMAIQLVDQLTQSFVPENYQDSYQDEIKQIIDEKLKGKKTRKAAVVEPAATRTQDLMSKLKASLKQHPRQTTTTQRVKKPVKKMAKK